MLTILGLVAVVALILANGYFVAAEFAFVAAKRGRLEDAAASGDRKAGRAVEVHRRLSFMLSGAQLGITVTSLAVGYIAEPALGQALKPLMGLIGLPERARYGVAVTVGFVLATVVQMVIGELAPKNLAIAKPEGVARALGGPTLIFLRVAAPVIRLFDGAANKLLRAVGIESADELHGGVSVQELDLIVEESAELGKLTGRQATLLERAIDFGSLHASEAMVPWNRTATIEASASCEDLRALIATTHSRFPVVDDDGRVVGVVHAKDLFEVPDDALGSTRVGALKRSALVVPETAGLRVVLAALRRESTAMAVVADEYGAPAGIVTFEDLAEELVGDIADEYDTAEPTLERDPDGSWVVPGSWRLDEIERATEVELPNDGTFDTVAGLVLARLQRIPTVGERIEVAGAAVEVVAMDGWAITAVRVVPPPDGHEHGDGDGAHKGDGQDRAGHDRDGQDRDGNRGGR